MLIGCGTLGANIFILTKFLYKSRAFRSAPICILVAILSAGTVFINTFQMTWVNLLSTYLMNVIIIFVLFKGNFALRFGFAANITTIAMSCENMMLVLAMVFTEDWRNLTGDPLYLSIMQLLVLLVLIAMGLVIARYFPQKYESFGWSDLFLVSFQILTVVATTLQLLFTMETQMSVTIRLWTLALYTAFMAASVLIFFIFNGALHKQELEKQIALYQYQFEQMKNSQAVIGRIEHDFEKHLLALKLDLNNAQPREAEQKIDALIGNLRLSKSVADSGNADVAAIINYKATQAEEYGIRIVCDLHLPYTLNMNTTDLSIILGNAIDNAIEACKTVEPAEREIALMINYEKTNLRMAISNPFVGELKMDATGELSTTKTRGRHGIGLKSIRETVEKYDGLMDISTEGNRFILKILLFNLPSQ